MEKAIIKIENGYLVYIVANKRKETSVGVVCCNDMNFISDLNKYSKLVYYEKFKGRRSAVMKMKIFAGYDKARLTGFISKKNPEWLNLIQIFNED